jgi:hypothetical protein
MWRDQVNSPFPHILKISLYLLLVLHTLYLKMSTLNASFEDAIRITPQGNNKYSADLRSEWCIGTGTTSLSQ